MRTAIFKSVYIGIMIALLVSLTGCTGLFQQNKSTANITIRLPQTTGKRSIRAIEENEVLSNNSNSINESEGVSSTTGDIAYYILVLTPAEGEPRILTAGKGSTEVIFQNVLPGSYTITVQAYLEDETIFAEGLSSEFTVIAGESTQVSVKLHVLIHENTEESEGSEGTEGAEGTEGSEGTEGTEVLVPKTAYTINSCKMEDENSEIANLLGGMTTNTLTFTVSDDSPLTVTNGSQATRTITALSDVDISNYEDGDYIPFITADNEIVLIRDYAVGTDFAAAYIDNGNIVTDAGVASGFTSGKYVALSNDFDPKANTWEYVMHFKTGTVRYDNTNNDHLTIKGNETDGDGFYACIWYGKFSLCVGTSGNPWTMTGNYFQGKHNVLSNQDYYVRIKYIGDAYTFEYSTDGGNTYTLDMALVKSSENSSGYNNSGNYTYMLCETSKWNTIVPDRPRFGAHTTGNLPFAGEFYMNDTYIKVSDEVYWTGAYGYTSAARMDTSGEKPVLMRMTDNGAEVWDAIPLSGATVSVQNGKVIDITQPTVSE